MGLRSKCWFAHNFSSFCLVQRYASWQFLCSGVVGENRIVCCPRKWFWTKRWNIPFQVGWCKTLGHSARFLKIKKLPHFISHFNTKNTIALCEFKGFFPLVVFQADNLASHWSTQASVWTFYSLPSRVYAKIQRFQLCLITQWDWVTRITKFCNIIYDMLFLGSEWECYVEYLTFLVYVETLSCKISHFQDV